MFLKTVSLYGFKTFALKTDFELKPGITAIVGPNGCGKSNLFDALVWVLGEQSARSIRGYKMEDVIFHGSDAKKPLGFAQVQLTFDNEDGYFPLPHSEISITRRYFKSNDSEFEINGQQCRLKDIQNLLLDTGMGKLNYSIISQGDIEYIIGLSPVERRMIFDEAAGINKYKHEKKKTLSKIKDTDINIARLRDLLTEIDERVGPLAKQAETARKYEELTERIEGLKMRVLVSDIRRIQAAIADTAAQGLAARSALQGCESAAATLRQNREDRRATLTVAHSAVSVSGQALGQLTGALDQHQQSLEILKNSIAQSEQAENRGKAEIKTIETRIVELENDIKQLTAKREAGLKDIETLEKELKAALPSELGDIGDELEHEKKLRERTAADRIELDSSREKLENLRAEIRQLNGRIVSLKEALNEKRRDIERAEKQIEQIDEKGKKKKTELAECSKQKEEIAARLKQLREKSGEERARMNQLRDTLDAEKENLSYQRARGEHLTALSRAANAKTPPPKQWLSLKDDKTPLPLQLKIKQGYEPAVRRALGALLDAWIINDTAAIRKLTPKQAGEMIFILADFIHPGGAASVKDVPGAIGALSEFASSDGPHATAVNSLLSRFVVVEDAATLASLAPKVKPGVALVTKAGDASMQDGLLQLGEGLGGREDMKKLCIEVEDASQQSRKKVSDLEKQVSDASRKIGDLSREIENNEAASRKAAIREVELSSASGSIGNEKSFHEKSIASLAEAAEKIDKQLGGLELELKSKAEKIKFAEQQYTTKKGESELTEKVLNELLERRRSAQALLQDLRIKLNNRRKDVEAIEENTRYRQSDIERATTRKSELDSEKKNIEKEIESRKAEYERAREQGKEIAAKVVTAKKEFADKQAAIQSIEEQIQSLGRDISASENTASEMREKLLQVQMRGARAEAQLEEARRVFAEEFPGADEEKAVAEAPQTAPGEKNEYRQLREEREALGPVNMLAIGEYEEEKSRFDLLYAQIEDLEGTRATLLEMVINFDDRSRDQFLETFAKINEKFKETFQEVFEGGTCEISLTDVETPLECGVDIAVAMPGKRMRNINLLSGGEKALCALTLIFAILKVKPSPFYLLDEVDAGLDEGNVDKFKRMLKKYSKEVQFFIITHNKGTLVGADHFYGITLNEIDGFTRVLSVSLENINAGQAQSGIAPN